MLANVNGTTLHYELLGDGPPLMLMHGGLGFDHTYFRPWVDPLAEDFTLILYDHRGNGRSERPPDLDDVFHSTWADDAEALRQHLGFDRMTLLGHSYGGTIAQHYAIRHQQHLAGLILATTYPAWDYTDVILERAREIGTPDEVAAIEARFFNHVANDEDMEELAAEIGGLYFH
ncbi:MAG: alpha/beta fold hydrolase, partial [Dehalococcoidia bacterium]|nr:alpha/beta fold hydrolase [Dehalococcoidia bacterium]